MWEDDNGLYCTEGVMAFQYEDKNDNTWSYSETSWLIKSLGIANFNINNDKNLIKAVHYKLEADKRGGYGEIPKDAIERYGEDHHIEFVDVRVEPIVPNLKPNQSLICGDLKTYYLLLTKKED